jgi:hypothetical protein
MLARLNADKPDLNLKNDPGLLCVHGHRAEGLNSSP